MDTPIKLGIIGCGIAARDLHLPALQKLKHKFEIVMVCNHTEPKARAFAELVGGVPYVLDYHELLQQKDVEAVDIVLPIHLNYQVTKDALEAGKHVLVEKPLAANLTEASAMLEFEDRYQRVMMVAENFRYRETFHRLKSRLQSGEIGAPYSVFWNVFHLVDSSNKYAQTRWRIHHQYPGGFITDGGVHNIAALRYLFGEFIAGNAFSRSINPEIGKLDTLSFQFKTEQHVNGVFNVFFSSNGYSENRVIILGDRGSFLIEDNTILWQRSGLPDQKEQIDDDGGYIGEFLDFYNGIRHQKMVSSDFREAFRDLEIIIKALETADSGLTVQF
ncbi:MAG: Gfo/Idh/MocA family oxidoreductase [bacterium]|nr:Gfo/Idh/MocA family oxidoreductase [bacterium]